MSKIKTRIRRIASNYYPEYRQGFFSDWEMLVVRIDLSGRRSYNALTMRDAELIIDKFLMTGDHTNGTIQVIKYPPMQ